MFIFAPAGDQTGAALAISKALNNFPVGVAYFKQVPPSIKVAEQRCVNVLVSEMLQRSVEEMNVRCSQ